VTILAIPNAAVAGFADQYRDSAGGCNHHRPVQPVPVARRRGDDHQGPRR
jgi:hypothetical protein